MIELSELTKNVLEIFEIETQEELSKSIYDAVMSDDIRKYEKFEILVQDLSVDWLQMIYQYWLADREKKKQDYTPKTLALFLAKMQSQNPEYEVMVDMCAGSGALTIQSWSINPSLSFECIEFDENVIPLLLFNLAVRNIGAVVKHQNVLSGEIFNLYSIEKRERFGKVVKIETTN